MCHNVRFNLFRENGMKRANIGMLAIILVVVLALLPFGMGFIVQNKFKSVLNQWVAQEAGVRAELLNYQRGFWSSTAEVMLSIADEEQELTTSTHQVWAHLLLKNSIKHGPVLWSRGKEGVRLSLGWALIQSQILKAVDNGYADKSGIFDGYFTINANMDTWLKFSNGLHTLVKANHFALEMPGRPQVYVNKATLNLDYAKHFTSQQATLHFLQLQLNNNDYETNFNDVSLQGSWEKTPYDFFTGHSAIDIANVITNKNKQQLNVLEKIHLDAMQQLKDKYLNAYIDLSIAHGKFDSQSYGPFYNRIEFNNISAPVLQQLQQQVKIISHSALPEQQKNIQVMSLIPLVPKLVAHGASVEIKAFDLRVPEGQISIQGYARIAKDKAQQPVAAIMQLLPKLTADVTVRLPKSLVKEILTKNLLKRVLAQHAAQAAKNHSNTADKKVEQTQELTMPDKQTVSVLVTARLQDWQQRGFLVQEKDRYKLSFSFKDGHILINNKALETGSSLNVIQNSQINLHAKQPAATLTHQVSTMSKPTKPTEPAAKSTELNKPVTAAPTHSQ